MTDFHPTEAFPSAITKGSLGAKPEAADLEQSFRSAPNPAVPGPPGSSDAQRAARALTGRPTQQTHLRHGQPIFAVMHKNTALMKRCGKVRSLA